MPQKKSQFSASPVLAQIRKPSTTSRRPFTRISDEAAGIPIFLAHVVPYQRTKIRITELKTHQCFQTMMAP
jgi:hypothetical protein